MPCSDLNFLVVEDHEFQRLALVQLLLTLGAKAVHGAEDGRAALQIMRDTDRPVDIVISDLMMPGMDGMALVRHLSETGDRVSVILTSALDKELLLSIGAMAEAYKVKLLGVVGKPATAVKLRPLIELHRLRAPGSPNPEARFSLDDIARAWTSDEFAPWFEPAVELGTGNVRGMNAVPRWNHSELGVLEAAEFMPSIQARGLNDDFAWLMLRKSAAQCRKWHEQGHELVVSVNASFASLTDVDLAPRIQQMAVNEGLDPRFMVLTVNEDSLDTGQGRALESLARFRVAGFGLGIDDFGSGFMAVDQLSRVAFTELKIKSSFVAESGSDESARAGLAVALDLAQRLRLKTVASGITSKHEWNLLYEWGCAFGQGPFIADPLQAEQVLSWLSQWSLHRG